MSVQVFIVDDQRVFLDVARALVESTPGFALAGEARSGEAALSCLDEVDPDLVLLDVRMPGLDGVETARRLTARTSAVVVLVTGNDDLDDVRERAVGCGAADVLRKERLRPAVLTELWTRHGTGRKPVA